MGVFFVVSPHEKLSTFTVIAGILLLAGSDTTPVASVQPVKSPTWDDAPAPLTRLGAGMRTACSVLAVVMLVFALGACGESDEEKAQNTVCDARDDIGKQVDDLKSLTPATVTADAVTQNLEAIDNDLNDMDAAKSDLSSDRRSDVEAANKAFESSVEGIVSDLGSSLSASDAKAAGRHCAPPARGVLPEGVRAAQLQLKGI